MLGLFDNNTKVTSLVAGWPDDAPNVGCTVDNKVHCETQHSSVNLSILLIDIKLQILVMLAQPKFLSSHLFLPIGPIHHQFLAPRFWCSLLSLVSLSSPSTILHPPSLPILDTTFFFSTSSPGTLHLRIRGIRVLYGFFFSHLFYVLRELWTKGMFLDHLSSLIFRMPTYPIGSTYPLSFSSSPPYNHLLVISR